MGCCNPLQQKEPVNRIKWRLDSVWPKQWLLTDTLPVLEAMPGLAEHAQQPGRRWPEVNALKAKDTAAGDASWRTALGLRLIRLHECFMTHCYRLRDAKLSNAWLAENCPPTGGHWIPDVQRAGSPVGKPCRQLYCPWCWMRRVYDLRALVTQPDVQLLDGRQHIGMNLSAVSLLQAESVTPLPYTPALKAAANEFRQRVELLVGNGLDHYWGPDPRAAARMEFLYAMRIVSMPADLVGGRLLVSYIYPESSKKPVELDMTHPSLSGDAVITRESGLDPIRAVLAAYPYVAQALSLPVEWLSSYLAANKRSKTYVVLGKSMIRIVRGELVVRRSRGKLVAD